MLCKLSFLSIWTNCNCTNVQGTTLGPILQALDNLGKLSFIRMLSRYMPVSIGFDKGFLGFLVSCFIFVRRSYYNGFLKKISVWKIQQQMSFHFSSTKRREKSRKMSIFCLWNLKYFIFSFQISYLCFAEGPFNWNLYNYKKLVNNPLINMSLEINCLLQGHLETTWRRCLFLEDIFG